MLADTRLRQPVLAGFEVPEPAMPAPRPVTATVAARGSAPSADTRIEPPLGGAVRLET